MVLNHAQKTSLPFGSKEILSYPYSPNATKLSATAEAVLEAYNKGPERHAQITALQLLDYLSSKKNYIRRKGKTFRNQDVYSRMLPLFSRVIIRGEPIKLSSICMCTALCNPGLVGHYPYPHMASYLGFENLHKIIKGAREIYEPGLAVILGYEGWLFKPMLFHNDRIIETTFQMLQELNDKAYNIVNPGGNGNPVSIIDAVQIVEKTFGSKKAFDKQVAAKVNEITLDDCGEWMEWYGKSTSAAYFSSQQHKEEFIADIARWRHAMRSLKLQGGKFNGGFAHFDPEIIPVTMSGRRQDMIALQLIPENPYMPHHRSITYKPTENKWRMKAYSELLNSPKAYVPRLVNGYDHPFYYEELE